MAYIDYEEYRSLTGDGASERGEVEGLLEAASRLVDGLCLGRLGESLEALSERKERAVRRATAAQVQYLLLGGGMDAAVSGAANYGGNVRIGSFSYGDGRLRDRSERALLDSRYAQAAVDALRPTGLLWAGGAG